MIDKEIQQQVEDLIDEIEQKSSCELVTVITEQSDDYTYIPIMFSALTALLYPMVHFAFFEQTSGAIMYNVQLLIFVCLFFTFKIDDIKMRLIPKSVKHKRANRNAHEQFISLGLHNTSNKQVVMFFVSMDERYVQIITDSAVKEKIDDSYWKAIVDIFTTLVKKGDFAKGYLEAIKQCSAILIKEFPSSSDDKNELPNHMIKV